MDLCINPFPKRQNLDSSKLKEFADDNFKFDEMAECSQKGEENTVEKEAIARYAVFQFIRVSVYVQNNSPVKALVGVLSHI